MHNRHLIHCGIVLAAAVAFVVVTGGSTGSLGLLMVALVCPLAMIVAVRVLIDRDRDTPTDASAPAPGADAHR